MAHCEMTMQALAVLNCEETCAGCFRKFLRGERMYGMRHSDGDSAGWHCGECLRVWQERGEDALPRWARDHPDDALPPAPDAPAP